MKILQQPIKVKRYSRVQVHFNRPCTVYLMTEVNFKRYKEGASFRRLGGQFEQSPAEFIAPYDGTWHAVIEKGSHFNPKPIEGRVEVLPPPRKETPYYISEEDTPKAEAAEAQSEVDEISEELENEDNPTEEEGTSDEDQDKKE